MKYYQAIHKDYERLIPDIYTPLPLIEFLPVINKLYPEFNEVVEPHIFLEPVVNITTKFLDELPINTPFHLSNQNGNKYLYIIVFDIPTTMPYITYDCGWSVEVSHYGQKTETNVMTDPTQLADVVNECIQNRKTYEANNCGNSDNVKFYFNTFTVDNLLSYNLEMDYNVLDIYHGFSNYCKVKKHTVDKNF